MRTIYTLIILLNFWPAINAQAQDDDMEYLKKYLYQHEEEISAENVEQDLATAEPTSPRLQQKRKALIENMENTGTIDENSIEELESTFFGDKIKSKMAAPKKSEQDLNSLDEGEL